MSGFISYFLKKWHSPAEWIEEEEEEGSQMNFGLARGFKYKELKKATNNFSTELGNGGYGRVYHGKLQDGQMVAVKVLFDRNPKRLEQFFNEVAVLSRLRHKNLVSLYGCTSPCSQELLLVYEYIPNGTVADHLHGKRTTLTWAMRVQIAMETAEALVYLHALEPPLIHRDVKTSNILLDYDFHVKVADFGICRLLPWDSTHVSTVQQGTMGYRDPEYERYFRLTKKADVYSFGVVLMELISGQQAVDVNRAPEDIYLDDMARKNIPNKKLDEFVDPILGYHSNNDVRRMVDSVAELATNCLQSKGDMRPSMLQVLTVLKGIQTEKHQMQHQDGRQDVVHVKGIQHEKQQQDNNSSDPQQELRDESLKEVYRGVEEVKTDCKPRTVVVKGKEADPIEVCDRIQRKTGQKVELISPLPKPPEEEKEEAKDPPPEDKNEEPKPITVILKVRMHCQACAQELQRRIKKMEGVESVVTDLPNGQVIVIGFVDPEKIVANVRRTKKHASIVQEEEKKEEKKAEEPEKKEEKIEEEKKEEEKVKEPEKKEEKIEKKAKEPEKKEEKIEEIEEEKKEEEKKAEEPEKKEEKIEEEDKKEDAKKIEYWPARDYIQYAPPPQIFSDENPNACYVM